jgi:hypothetical protein
MMVTIASTIIEDSGVSSGYGQARERQNQHGDEFGHTINVRMKALRR